MLEEYELENHFDGVFTSLIQSEKQQQNLAENIQKLALPNATKDIVHQLNHLVNGG